MLTGSDMSTNTLTSGIVSSPARPRIQNAGERVACFSYWRATPRNFVPKSCLYPRTRLQSPVFCRVSPGCVFSRIGFAGKRKNRRPQAIWGDFVRMICADPPIADFPVRQLASSATAMPDRGLPSLPHSVAGIRTMNFRRPLAPHCQRFSRWGDCGAALGPVAS